MVACFYIDLTEVAVNGQVVPVSDNDRVVITRNDKDTGDFSVENCQCIGTRRGLNINSVVVCPDIFQFLVLLLAECGNNRVASGNGIRQTAFISGKVGRKLFLGLCHGISAFRVGYPFFLFVPFSFCACDLFRNQFFYLSVQCVCLFFLFL